MFFLLNAWMKHILHSYKIMINTSVFNLIKERNNLLNVCTASLNMFFNTKLKSAKHPNVTYGVFTKVRKMATF